MMIQVLEYVPFQEEVAENTPVSRAILDTAGKNAAILLKENVVT